MTDDIDKYPDRVAENIKDRTIFITGGTGFLGKVLIEKMLRCMEPKRIYLLIREKKGKNPKDRLREIFQTPLFEQVRKQKGDNIFERCLPIAGDVSMLGLGISDKDKETLVNEVEIVFHAAATIRFDDPLKKAVLLNTRGTKLILELALEMKKLAVFIHVSTSYCHLGEKVLYEKAYPAHADPHQVIRTVEWMNEDLVDAMTPALLGTMPNTYAFTKNLSEALCVEQLEKLPLIIVRPSVVVPIWKEPIPGWADNINGPIGLMIGAGKGVIRTMYCNQEGYADFIPVDVVANALLCSAWDAVYTGLWRVQKRVSKGFEVFEYYANNQWDFNYDQSMEARDLLNPKERQLYKVDGDGVDYVEYFATCTHAARLYILKETDDTIPAAKRHMMIMYFVDRITKILFCGLILYMLYKYLIVPIVGDLF